MSTTDKNQTAGNGFKAGSNLEKVLAGGHFAITAELGPPKSADVAVIEEKAAFLKGKVDAVNITDNQTAVVRMSSKAASAIMVQAGLEPNFQMVCRDRNRIAMQSDILGCCALGIRNMLCLSGDHQQFGNHPESKNVYDIDSMQLIALVKKMRDEGKFLNGEDIDEPPKMFIGAASNPFGDPVAFRVYRLANKIAAGADFIQTQCIFNMERFAEFIRQANEMGLTDKVSILAGVTSLQSAGMARYMQKNVPGMDVPDGIIRRMEAVDKKQQAEEGIRICCEQISRLRQMPGVAGVHIMAIEWEQRVPEIVAQAGLLPRPAVEPSA